MGPSAVPRVVSGDVGGGDFPLGRVRCLRNRGLVGRPGLARLQDHPEFGPGVFDDADQQVSAFGAPGQRRAEVGQGLDLAVGDVGDQQADLQAPAIGRAARLDAEDDQAGWRVAQVKAPRQGGGRLPEAQAEGGEPAGSPGLGLLATRGRGRAGVVRRVSVVAGREVLRWETVVEPGTIARGTGGREDGPGVARPGRTPRAAPRGGPRRRGARRRGRSSTTTARRPGRLRWRTASSPGPGPACPGGR